MSRTTDIMPAARAESAALETLRIALPMILLNLSLAGRTFFDMLFVSRLGRDETAALLPASEWHIALLALPMGMIMSWKAFISQSYGKNEPAECGAYAWQALWFAAGAGLAVMAPALFSDRLFALTGHSESVRGHEALYFNWMLAGSISALVSWALMNFFIGIGDSFTPMLFGALGNLLNIAACRVLTLGYGPVPAFGVAGTAWANILNYSLISIGLAICFWRRDIRSRYRLAETMRFRPAYFRRMLRIGLPRGVRKSMELACFAMIVTLVGRFGEAQLAGNNIAVRIFHLAILPAYGFGVAATTLVGQHIGARNLPRSKSCARWSILFGLCWSGALSLAYLLVPGLFCRLFGADPETLVWAKKILACIAAYQIIESFNIAMAGALEGAGDTAWTLMAGLSCMWGIFLTLAIAIGVSLGGGVIGVWTAGVIYSTTLCALLTWRFKSGRWEKIDIFR